jgi:hypothetical protein
MPRGRVAPWCICRRWFRGVGEAWIEDFKLQISERDWWDDWDDWDRWEDSPPVFVGAGLAGPNGRRRVLASDVGA